MQYCLHTYSCQDIRAPCRKYLLTSILFQDVCVCTCACIYMHIYTYLYTCIHTENLTNPIKSTVNTQILKSQSFQEEHRIIWLEETFKTIQSSHTYVCEVLQETDMELPLHQRLLQINGMWLRFGETKCSLLAMSCCFFL